MPELVLKLQFDSPTECRGFFAHVASLLPAATAEGTFVQEGPSRGSSWLDGRGDRTVVGIIVGRDQRGPERGYGCGTSRWACHRVVARSHLWPTSKAGAGPGGLGCSA